MNYYRLKMYNKNGKYSYSDVVKAFVNSNDAFYVEVYPNPVTNNDAIVKLNSFQGNNGSIQITDVTGKVIKTFKMNSNIETVNVGGFANGIYLIKYSDEHYNQTIKMNKQ